LRQSILNHSAVGKAVDNTVSDSKRSAMERLTVSATPTYVRSSWSTPLPVPSEVRSSIVDQVADAHDADTNIVGL